MSPVQQGPLWTVLLVPVLLGTLALCGAAFARILEARADGRRISGVVLAAPLAESGRLLVQQRRTVVASDRFLARTGVVLVPVAAVGAALVVPLGSTAASDLSVGIVWFNAMEIVMWAALWMAGWGTNSVWGLVGGYRFVVQGMSYELPHMFALITVATGAASLSVADAVAAQDGLWFVVWMPVAFMAFLLSSLALSFAGPFDTATGRDVAGGVLAEFSGVDRLLLLAGRWLLLAAAAAMSVPLFLGGGAGPLLPPWLWTVLKTVAVLGVLVWVRSRTATVRMDRFAEFGWIVLIPLTLLQALVVAVVVVSRGTSMGGM
ncbi:complex I subunit 1 family protein [Pseudonocardia abyssalis]|uniref:NADH-quinone oxidoreductase subunit H n=1 Tax=Pseudonocardia abyssalis TaxID=2792008 RepID=A0ABS6URN2_9PSEU|nr:complex I subunit 1 family protein [Pseudonocardia abyssalis]MBW0113841.1 NADH-quinone oxidoreductase subunit H [Pseudonocardia abyssalis]MBW0134917.1 NADH-quinone oxidoreductase subunit H [Pseudonocardia abyssalis]